jgi:hypothetical protein
MTPFFFTSLATLVLLGHLESSVAFKCGGTLTTACLGDTDIRYDPDVSNALVDQAEIWKKSAGYFVEVGTIQIEIPGTEQLTPPLDVTSFQNISVVGSRFQSHSISFSPSFAAVGASVVFVADLFATTTHEKNGILLALGNAIGTSAFQREGSYPLSPVDENSFFVSFIQSDGDVSSASYFFLDEGATTFTTRSSIFENRNGTFFTQVSINSVSTRVTEAEWIAAANNIYNELNIPDGDRIPVPFIRECLGTICPTELDWCTQDPECSPSPYSEPDAQVKPGAVAGFIIAGIVILTAGLYLIHLYLAAQQAKRYRTIFAMRIADTIQVRKSMRSLTPEILAKEFKQIDSQTQDGQITKEELWAFLSTGAAGELNQSDFNALFAAIDTDKSGYVDFLEFCTFMGNCHEEYAAARTTRGDRMNAMDRTSRRLSIADIAVSAGEDMAGGEEPAKASTAEADAKMVAEMDAGEMDAAATSEKI